MAATNFTPEVFYVAGTAVLVIFLLRVVFKGHKPNLPPGPVGLPIIGILHHMTPHPHQMFAELARQYGPLVSFRLGQNQCVVVSSDDIAMEFLKNQDINFSSRPQNRASEVCFYEDIIFHTHNTPGIWRHMRTLFQEKLTSLKQLEATGHVREEEYANMVRMIPRDGMDVQLNIPLASTITNIVSRMVVNKRLFGDKGMEEVQEVKDFREIVTDLSQCVSIFNPRDFIPAFKWLDVQGLETRFQKLHMRMDLFVTNILSEHIERRKNNPNLLEQEKDMVDILLDHMEVTEGHQLSEAQVKGLIWDAFAAGTKTSQTTSEWVMAEIVRNPDIMKKAQAELDAVVGRSRLVQESDISSLKYLHAIVKETFRLHPALPLLIPHQSTKACKAFGYDIPAKTRLFFNVWAIGRDPTNWENPLEFQPERFMKGGPCEAIDYLGQNYKLLPFGSGRRTCPGMVLGATMVHTMVANLLHAFEWSHPSNLSEAKEIDLTEGVGISITLATPLHAIAIRERLPSHLYKP